MIYSNMRWGLPISAVCLLQTVVSKHLFVHEMDASKPIACGQHLAHPRSIPTSVLTMERPSMAVQDALVVRPVLLAGHIHPITTNYMPNVSVTLRSPHAAIMVHPLQESEIHLDM